tara:strand:- start:568 stop:816 length:249 start_codon:yes stop_codon:yes gene_type:complete
LLPNLKIKKDEKLIMAIAILSFGFTSCKKDDKCKTCTTTSTIDGEVQDFGTDITAEYCGDALDAIDGQTVTVSGMTTSTTCK